MGMTTLRDNTLLIAYWRDGKVWVQAGREKPTPAYTVPDHVIGVVQMPDTYIVDTVPVPELVPNLTLRLVIPPNGGGAANLNVNAKGAVSLAWNGSDDFPADFFDGVSETVVRLDWHGDTLGAAARWEVLYQIAQVPEAVEVALDAQGGIVEAFWMSGGVPVIRRSPDGGATWPTNG